MKADEPTTLQEPAHAARAADFWQALRPLHWMKNAFVLAPLLFTAKVGEATALWTVAAAFAIFCLAASSIYLVNDVRDRKADALHPSKFFRPITRGLISTGGAIRMAVALAVLSLMAAVALDRTLLWIVVLYLVSNVLYTVVLKKILIVDSLVIAVGFVLRLHAGAVVIDVQPSPWIVLSTFFLSLLIAFAKRRYEVYYDENVPGAIHAEYTPFLLDIFITISATLAVMSYVGYVWTKSGWENKYALVGSVAVVVFGIFRYLAIVYDNEEREEHTRMILRDGPLMTGVVIWGTLMLLDVHASLW